MRLTKPKLGSGIAFLDVAIAFTSITTVAAQTNPGATSGSGLTLIGTHWKLIELNGKSVLHGERPPASDRLSLPLVFYGNARVVASGK